MCVICCHEINANEIKPKHDRTLSSLVIYISLANKHVN